VPTTLHIDSPSPGTLVLQLNRPEWLNAINEVLLGDLTQLCVELAADRDVRVVVLTGAGRGFCSGIDLRDFGPSVPDAGAPAKDRLRFQERMASLPQGLRALPQPVIAAVNGPAVGGGLALCLAADVRVCSTSASFANAAILLGLSGAEMGMSYHLPRIVGTSVAADWMLTGRTVSADEAHRRGLVSELVDDDRLLDRALALEGFYPFPRDLAFLKQCVVSGKSQRVRAFNFKTEGRRRGWRQQSCVISGAKCKCVNQQAR
jgi:enoyl-CoA hydratase/carnithine racemase